MMFIRAWRASPGLCAGLTLKRLVSGDALGRSHHCSALDSFPPCACVRVCECVLCAYVCVFLYLCVCVCVSVCSSTPGMIVLFLSLDSDLPNNLQECFLQGLVLQGSSDRK